MDHPTNPYLIEVQCDSCHVWHWEIMDAGGDVSPNFFDSELGGEVFLCDQCLRHVKEEMGIAAAEEQAEAAAFKYYR